MSAAISTTTPTPTTRIIGPNDPGWSDWYGFMGGGGGGTVEWRPPSVLR